MLKRIMLGVRLARRDLARHRGLAFVLAATVAAAVCLVAVAQSVQATAAYSASETAAISMGSADLQVRSSDYERTMAQLTTTGTATLPIASTIPHQAELDLDLQLVLGHGKASSTVTGRMLDLNSPLARGVMIRKHPSSQAGIALSAAVMNELHVSPGQTITILAAKASIPVRVSEQIANPVDLDGQSFVLAPHALTTTDLAQVITTAPMVSAGRWLVSSPQSAAIGASLRQDGYRVLARAGVRPFDTPTPELGSAPAAMIVAIALCVLGAGLMLEARRQRDQTRLLRALGVWTSVSTVMIVAESWLVMVVGALVGLGASLLLAPPLTHLLAARAGQDWGAMSWQWTGTGALLAGGLVIGAVLAVIGLRQTGAAHGRQMRPASLWSSITVAALAVAALAGAALISNPVLAVLVAVVAGVLLLIVVTRVIARGRRLRRGRLALRLGTRLALRSSGATTAAALAIGLLVALSTSSVYVLDATAAGHAASYVPDQPIGSALVSLPTALTAADSSHLADASGSVVASFAPAGTTRAGEPVPVVVRDAFWDCAQSTDNTNTCVDKLGDAAFEPNGVGIAPDARAAAALIGRDLTPAESASFSTGDGLMFSAPGAAEKSIELVPPVGADTSGGRIRLAPAPVSVDHLYSALPLVLISPATAARLGLANVETDRASYVLTPLDGGHLDESSIRSALPPSARGSASITVEAGPPYVHQLATITDTTLAITVAGIAIIITVIGASWAADSAAPFGLLGVLGMPKRRRRYAAIARGAIVVVPALVIGLGIGAYVAWLFASRVGAPLSGAGMTWLLPLAFTVVAAILTAAILAPVGSPRPHLGRARAGADG